MLFCTIQAYRGEKQFKKTANKPAEAEEDFFLDGGVASEGNAVFFFLSKQSPHGFINCSFYSVALLTSKGERGQKHSHNKMIAL